MPTEREFGELTQVVRGLAKDLGKVEIQVNTVDGKVDSILSRFDRLDGGWATLMWVGGIVGVFASVATTVVFKVFPFLLGNLPRL